MADQAEYCKNCKRTITHNASLHILHCAKNLSLCQFCGEPIPLIDVEKHMKSMHTIELCKHCRKPTEKWKLEEHENSCMKKPIECKFCNLDVAADDFQDHSMCWNRTEKCSTCSQYVKLKDMEIHEKVCKNSSKLGYTACKFCKENFPWSIIDCHESMCGEKATRCPDCGDRIKQYKNSTHSCRAKKKSSSSSANTRSKEVYPIEEKRESSSGPPSKDKYRSLPSLTKEPPNQAVEVSPPVQRDFSVDSKSNRVLEKESWNMSGKCKLCDEYLVPSERRIHPEICKMRSQKCVYCEEHMPYCFLKPELHNCWVSGMPIVYNESGQSEKYSNSRKENDAVGYSSTSNSSRDNFKIDTQNCPLCFKSFPVDRFDTHVRACAENKTHCYLCKKDFFGDQKEHFMKCSGKEPNKKKEKQKKEKKESFWASIPYLGRKGRNSESKSSSDFMKAENQNSPVVSLVPCEFCNEVYPFEDIILHESGCHKYEVSPAKEQRKEPLKESSKDEVLQAYGFTPYDYSKYMPTDPDENMDRQTRNKRSSNKSFEEKSQKSFEHQSGMYQEDFYERCLVKDHEKSILAEKYLYEPRKGVEEGKKKDVLFTFSSEPKKEFSVKENRIEQGVKPKNKERYHHSNSDEGTIPYQSKEKCVRAENIKGFSNSSLGSKPKLNAIGSEREQKKYGLESNQDKNFSSVSDKISSASQEAHDVRKKKGSFNSENTESSEEVYVSCEEGEDFPETDQLNMEVLTKEKNSKEKHSNTVIEGGNLSKEKDCLTNYRMSNYESGVINSDEKLASHSNTNQDHIHPFRATDVMASNAPFFVIHNPLSPKEPSSLLEKLVINMDDLEIEADEKNEETFASNVLADANFNPFEAMSNSQFSYETVSSLPPYSTVNSDIIDLSADDIKSDDNLDAYLQFLGVSESEPDASCRLFENYQSRENTYGHELKLMKPDPSNRLLENLQFGASGSNTHDREAKPTSLQLKQKVLVEDLKGVSKNMPSYTSPFLLENESEEVESISSKERNFPASFQREKKKEENGRESKINVKSKSEEEKDNEENWKIWRSPRQIDSDSDE